MSVAFHEMMESCNILSEPTKQIAEFFEDHGELYKAALIANHLFRAVAMVGLMHMLPFTELANFAICLAGSFFYRLTVEKNCAYKFALPACFGSIAFPLAYTPLNDLINGTAFNSLEIVGYHFAALIPLMAYMTYIVLTVDYDVGHK